MLVKYLIFAHFAHLIARSLTHSLTHSLTSFSLQAAVLMAGSSWLCQRSLHCFPLRPGSSTAIFDHFFAPRSSTRRFRVVSSEGVQV